jgi:hypothetical protein
MQRLLLKRQDEWLVEALAADAQHGAGERIAHHRE